MTHVEAAPDSAATTSVVAPLTPAGTGPPPEDCHCNDPAKRLPDPGQVFLGALSVGVLLCSKRWMHVP